MNIVQVPSVPEVQQAMHTTAIDTPLPEYMVGGRGGALSWRHEHAVGVDLVILWAEAAAIYPRAQLQTCLTPQRESLIFIITISVKFALLEHLAHHNL